VQDAVPRTGKFMFLYKRPGQRVFLSPRADLVVRPSPLELRVHLISGGAETTVVRCKVGKRFLHRMSALGEVLLVRHDVKGARWRSFFVISLSIGTCVSLVFLSSTTHCTFVCLF
jgi:hypothetical protein